MKSNKFINILTKIIVMVIIIVGLFIIGTVFFSSNEAEAKSEKNAEEVRYLDNKLLSLINYLNNIELQNYKLTITKVEPQSNSSESSSKNEDKSNDKSSQENSKSGDGTNESKEETEISKMEEKTVVEVEKQTDWKTIESETELLYSVWPTIVLDLYSTGMKSEDVLAFSTALDETTQNVKNKDKALSAMYIAKLYSFLPKFLNDNSLDEVQKKTLEAKTYIINAYAFAETENFDKMTAEIEKAEGIFTGLVNDAKYVNDKRKYNINKAYILIEELKNSLGTKNVDIFYVKYKNTLEELNVLF